MNDSEIRELALIDAAAMIRDGALTASKYSETLLAQCQKLASLHAFITLEPDRVATAAAEADRQRERGEPMGPLHGIPIPIKDNIDVAGLPTTAGTPGLKGNVPETSAAVVRKLVDAGAIILGKLNMHEFAGGVKTNNTAFGTALNPYDRQRSPGGSSGGTAIAVAARMTPCAIGTDTGGSNRVPAAHCGVVGFRPSTHHWSQEGMLMASPTSDTAGPMTRNMADCALVDAVVTGDWSQCPGIRLEGLRLGVPRATFWSPLDGEVERVVENCLTGLREAGVILVEGEIEDALALTQATTMAFGGYEMEPTLREYLTAARSPLDAAQVFAEAASPDVQAFLNEWIGSISEIRYQEAQTKHRPKLQENYRRYFEGHAVDAIIYPTSPIPSQPVSASDDLEFGGEWVSELFLTIRNTNPAAIAGIPSLSLPAGQTTDGLPVGITIDGPADDDRRLLAIGAAIEEVLPRIQPPCSD